MFALFFGRERRGGEKPVRSAPFGGGTPVPPAGNVYTNDPHVADAAMRDANLVRPGMEMPRAAARKRLEACVKRWRRLATLERPDVREAIEACADDLENALERTKP